MYEYDEECLQTFLNMQSQLFDEPVAETLEEASEVFALPNGQYLIVEG